MPHLWGHQFSRAELMARVGDVSQVGGVREYRLDGGAGDGLAVVDVNTGSGLRFTVIPGRALDISGAWFNGIPLGFRSAAGEMHGAYYEPEGWGWVRSTVLGLLVTGGLDNVGDPAVDPDRLYTPTWVCTDASRTWPLRTCMPTASGAAMSSKCGSRVAYGKLRCSAKTWSSSGGYRRRLDTTSIRIHDEVTNLGAEPEPAMILFPFQPRLSAG